MYASQTKRLCVRGSPSDETTTKVVQPLHPSTSTSGSSQTTNTNNQQQTSNTPIVGDIQNLNMTASTANILNQSGQPASLNENELIQSSSAHSITAHSNEISGNQQQCLYNSANAQLKQYEGKSENELIDRLAKETLEEVRIQLLLSIRNLITACNKKKESIVNNPNFIKVINLIDDNNNVINDHNNKNDDRQYFATSTTQVKTQLALLICSIAKSGENTVRILNNALVDDKIMKLIVDSRNNDEALIEACLRCMRSIMSWPRVSRTWILYENEYQKENPTSYLNTSSPMRDATSSFNQIVDDNYSNLQKIVSYATHSNSHIIQECIADLFAATCARSKDQALLYKASAIPCIVQLLESQSLRVIIASLNWLTQMCLKNHLIALEIVNTTCPSNKPVLDRLTTFMNKDRCLELQFLSARCFAHIYRALSSNNLKNDSRITSHVIPTLVRMVHKDKPPQLRIKSAECIAYLIERDTKLQSTASICDHLIESLANMLEYEHNSVLIDLKSYTQTTQYKCSRVQDRGVSWLSITTSQPSHQQPSPPPLEEVRPFHAELEANIAPPELSCAVGHSELNLEMKRSSFLALAALGSNLETIRKKIFNTCSVMQHLVKTLSNSDTRTLKSVLTCLLSLSRSVQQLRTSFAENSVYSGLKNLLTTTSNDVLILVLAILCNISLDFSPGKQHFLDSKTIDILCNLTRDQDPSLRLHGMWILMNMAYQLKDQNLKYLILRSLGVGHMLSLLEIEDDDEIVLKTLGLLRNLLSQKSHIDGIMSSHGEQIMQALYKLLEKPCSKRIKEQDLCVLTNIADGNESKAFIMKNDKVLDYLDDIIADDKAGDLRLAAICCITNLAHKGQEKSFERRIQMKNYGFEDTLKSLLNTNDPVLSDRVRTAYNQFLMLPEDKYIVN